MNYHKNLHTNTDKVVTIKFHHNMSIYFNIKANEEKRELLSLYLPCYELAGLKQQLRV